MRGISWWVAVVVLGLTGAGIALLVDAGVWPGVALIGAAFGIPLLVLGIAFIGLARSSSVVGWAVVSLTAVVAPVVDMATGEFDANEYGFASSIAIAAAGAIAVVSVLAMRRGRPRVDRSGRALAA